MNLPQIRGAINANNAEANTAIFQPQFNICLFKIEAPSEYRDVGLSLSRRRKHEADDGQSHLTAAQLGLLFKGLVPDVPNLIRAYGLRCSEIAKSPTFNPKGTPNHGLFANEVGADGTAVWAAATSGHTAIAVHLLGCMLSRMWHPPEAISIWMQLIDDRKKTLACSGDPLDRAMVDSICLTRDQIASWHTSVQAWRQTADEANTRRQSQLLLIINNLGIPVNTKLCLSESVLDAWITAMTLVDKLVSGQPQSVQTGAPLLGLASWHLYPNMLVFGQSEGSEEKEVSQNDPYIVKGGVLTLGIQDRRRRGDGIYWSLPLSYLRYYGQPVQSQARLSSGTSRASFDELIYVALGSLIRRWLAETSDIEHAATLLVQLGAFVEIPGSLQKEGSWLALLASFAAKLLASEPEATKEKLQLVKCGRRRFPLFVDDPTADTIFGLSCPKTLLGLLPGNAARVALLRHVAQDFSDHRTMMIIQCKCDITSWELASVEPLSSITKRSCEAYQEGPSCAGHARPRRYIRWLNRLHTDKDQHDVQPNSDALRLHSPIPSFYAPNGYQWQNPPMELYAPLLEQECNHSKWRGARGVTMRSILAFGDPDMAALYCISISYWSSFTPNIDPQLIPGPRYRELPNIFVLRHVLWALQEELPSKENLFDHLSGGRFSGNILTSLKALQTAWALYGQLQEATVELRAAEQPLYEHQWVPQDHRDHRHHPFAGYRLNREQTFACISKFESGRFNIHPSAMKGVLAISSGNSIYVASCLLQDPCHPRSSRTVERVVGNLGKAGMALLVCPAVPQVRPLSDDIRLVNHDSFNGNEKDSFRDTGLHLSYTEWEMVIDVGSRGKRDVEAYYVEIAIGVYDRGEWVADLNVLDIFNHRLSRIVPECRKLHDGPALIEETSKFVTIDSWEELLDSPTEVGVVRARGNWQARLAAAALSIQRGHETRIVPEKTCWSCCLALKKVPPAINQKDDTIYFGSDVFGTFIDHSDRDGSDSETEEIVAMATRKKKQTQNGQGSAHSEDTTQRRFLDRNIVYIL